MFGRVPSGRCIFHVDTAAPCSVYWSRKFGEKLSDFITSGGSVQRYLPRPLLPPVISSPFPSLPSSFAASSSYFFLFSSSLYFFTSPFLFFFLHFLFPPFTLLPFPFFLSSFFLPLYLHIPFPFLPPLFLPFPFLPPPFPSPFPPTNSTQLRRSGDAPPRV